ncbi:MAG: hypothetical protein DRI44_07280 [Chlamydiae bacterium]|nr:MAG: hypothetical protein DRI44_07280 [Chlamydiota bacterium]
MTRTKEDQIYRESHLRSVLKAFSWRFVATSTTFAIVYLVTGKLSFATSIAGVEVITKMVIYYFHERAWQLLPRGSIRTLLKRNKHNKPDAGDGK